MKELTIQDKAELYDKALERARTEYKNHEAFKGFCEMLVNIFPELKESRDENIRKWLLDFVQGLPDEGLDFHFYNLTKEEVLTWLEKQGEQNPTWSEDDEKTLQSIILDFKDFKHDHASCLAPHFDICIAWLKSLKDRYTWKPTEEQINAIRIARNSFVRNDSSGCSFLNKTLFELENQLKKIKEE